MSVSYKATYMASNNPIVSLSSYGELVARLKLYAKQTLNVNVKSFEVTKGYFCGDVKIVLDLPQSTKQSTIERTVQAIINYANRV